MKEAVYQMYDIAGRLLYIGRSLNYLARLAQHCAGTPWWDDVADVKLIHCDSHDEAMLVEKRLIAEKSPIYNRRAGAEPRTGAHVPQHVGVGQRVRKRSETDESAVRLGTGLVVERRFLSGDRYRGPTPGFLVLQDKDGRRKFWSTRNVRLTDEQPVTQSVS